ncbi:type VI secretion system contractile sheath domain-containing protein [Variovorax ginsengisoli]|uniref:Type VI secretion system protein ImpC n=1 Tax=Variovorax ginsengisoli TaxID=363844 RepID=A0ABT9S9Y5_9BURK|nr:type VI secretion system contractile sheath large subunit [Variovorax ginsengisoli]MDP9901025.1 type VI secretion system protein ImpC [Variovorax ginsengisoli]
MTIDWTPNFGGIGLPATTWNPKRPLRIAILGDFGGGALAGRLETGAALARRKPQQVEFDTLEDALSRLQLKMTLPLGRSGAPVQVTVSEMESFHPDALYRDLEIFSALASLRKRLDHTATFAAAAAEMKDWGLDTDAAASPIAMRSHAKGGALSAGANLDDFARLTGRAQPAARSEDVLIGALLRRIVSPFVVAAAAPNKDALIASVDQALADAMRAVLHQPDFQNVESLWRGVDFLLRRLETSHQLQVHLIDISAEELAADLSGVDDLADSGLYRQLVATQAEEADGGYAYIAACYRFEATPSHAELLGRAARVAAHAQAPFITAIAPDAFTDRREPPQRRVREAFTALKDMPDASFLALMTPRFLLRHPYGKKSDPISSFAFEEFDAAAGLRGMLWGHPALLAVSVLATRDVPLTIGDLPFHCLIDKQGDTIALPCTERMVNTDAAALLRDFGINAVMARKGEPLVRLSDLQAINGDDLASSPGAPRKAASDSRASIGMDPDLQALLASLDGS